MRKITLGNVGELEFERRKVSSFGSESCEMQQRKIVSFNDLKNGGIYL